MTGARPDTWMPMYWGDYFGDTRSLTTLEHGAYLLLIGTYWRRGKPLPDDAGYLSRAAGVSRKQWFTLSAKVMGFFSLQNGEWHHKRIEQEILRSSKAYAKRHNAAMQRWCKADVTTTTTTTIEERESGTAVPATTKGKPNGSHSGRGQRLPTDWQPDPEDTTFAEQLGLDSLAVAARFRDYWHAKPGQGGVKVDWKATWRNWCRKDADNPGRATNGTGGHGAGYDRREAGSVMAAAARVIARQKGGSGL